MTEAQLGKRLGEVLKNIHIPDDVLAQLEQRFNEDHRDGENKKKEHRQKLEQRLSTNFFSGPCTNSLLTKNGHLAIGIRAEVISNSDR